MWNGFSVLSYHEPVKFQWHTSNCFRDIGSGQITPPPSQPQKTKKKLRRLDKVKRFIVLQIFL